MNIQRIRDRFWSRRRNEEGFTLIELLVVVIIIGILAAIAIPTFLSQRSKAQDSDAKSGARNVASQVSALAADCNGVFNVPTLCTTAIGLPDVTGADSGLQKYNKTGNSVAVDNINKKFSVVIKSDSGKICTYTSNDSVISCVAP